MQRPPIYTAVWLDYPAGKLNHGGGGWSRQARHRPQPSRHTVTTQDIQFKGRSVIVAGVRKLKLNLYRAEDGAAIRADYPTTGLTAFHH